MNTVRIGTRAVGPATPVYVIAELSANHGGSLARAIATVKAAAAAGADAVKLQTYTPDTMTIDGKQSWFQTPRSSAWAGRSLYDLYRQAQTPWKWHPALQRAAVSCGIALFSSPFDRSAVDFLESLAVPAYKIASFEITDIPLIEYVASKKKPVIFSTGVARLAEIREAVRACRRMGNEQILILKCTSAYPAPLEDMNLRTIPDMIRRFHCPVGLSDHSLGISAAVAAVSLGARIIEKHFIRDRSNGGVDSQFSLEPAEFTDMVRTIREVEKALGKVSYELSPAAARSRVFCRSLFVTRDIAKGERFDEDNVHSLRPSNGLLPKYISRVLGKKAKRRLSKGTPLSWNMIQK